VVGLKGAAVRVAEGDRQLILGVLEVVAESLRSEVEATIDIR
jgi:hypothetical protein